MWPKVSGLGGTWGPTSHQKCWLLELSSISLERTHLHRSPSHQLLPFVPFNLENWAGLKCVGFQTHLEQVSSVQSSLSHVRLSRPHKLQHARPPCPSPTPRVHPNPCLSTQWCHPTISSSAVPFSSCLQSFPASRSFQMSQLFTRGGQSTGVSTSASVLPMKT